jgi:hypothetical protein
MSPQELINQQVKAHANNFRAVRNLVDLTINARYYLVKLQFNTFKIMSYFKKKEVIYAGLDAFKILTPM